jgi:hypothetical protein
MTSRKATWRPLMVRRLLVNEIEINERVRFKLDQVWQSIENQIKLCESAAWNLDTSIGDTQRLWQRKELLEELLALLDKEASMAVPHDDMAERALNSIKDKAVDTFMGIVDLDIRSLPPGKRRSILQLTVALVEAVIAAVLALNNNDVTTPE